MALMGVALLVVAALVHRLHRLAIVDKLVHVLQNPAAPWAPCTMGSGHGGFAWWAFLGGQRRKVVLPLMGFGVGQNWEQRVADYEVGAVASDRLPEDRNSIIPEARLHSAHQKKK
jgi:hypothetical protein